MWFITWKRCIRYGMWKGLEASMPRPGAPLSLHPHMFTDPAALESALLGFYGGFMTWSWWMESLYADDWFCLQPLPSRRWEESRGTEHSNPLITWLAPLATSPQPQVPPKVLINITKETPSSLSTLRKFQAFFRAVIQKLGMKTKYMWEIDFGHPNDEIHISYKPQCCRSENCRMPNLN